MLVAFDKGVTAFIDLSLMIQSSEHGVFDVPTQTIPTESC